MKQNAYHTISQEILEMLRGDSPRERLLHRLHCVTLVLNGLSSSAVARIYGDSPRAVAYWIKRFKKDGEQGLHEESRPGRPSKLNASQLKHVQIFLDKSPAQSKSERVEHLVGYILVKFGITLTVRQCRRIVNRLQV
jgi:transposase